jgi:hypothetical protein
MMPVDGRDAVGRRLGDPRGEVGRIDRHADLPPVRRVLSVEQVLTHAGRVDRVTSPGPLLGDREGGRGRPRREPRAHVGLRRLAGSFEARDRDARLGGDRARGPGRRRLRARPSILAAIIRSGAAPGTTPPAIRPRPSSPPCACPLTDRPRLPGHATCKETPTAGLRDRERQGGGARRGGVPAAPAGTRMDGGTAPRQPPPGHVSRVRRWA